LVKIKKGAVGSLNIKTIFCGYWRGAGCFARSFCKRTELVCGVVRLLRETSLPGLTRKDGAV